jgi:hypothetical protein
LVEECREEIESLDNIIGTASTIRFAEAMETETPCCLGCSFHQTW